MFGFTPFRKKLRHFFWVFFLILLSSCKKNSVSYNETILPLDQFVPFGNAVSWSKQVRTVILSEPVPQKVTRLLRDRDDNIWLLRSTEVSGQNAHYLEKYDPFGNLIVSIPFEKGMVPGDIAIGSGGEVTLVESRLTGSPLPNNTAQGYQIWLRQFSQNGTALQAVLFKDVIEKNTPLSSAYFPKYKLLATTLGLYLAGTLQGLELYRLNSSLEVSWNQSVFPPEISDSNEKTFDFFLAGSQSGQLVIAHGVDAKHLPAWQKFLDPESNWKGEKRTLAATVYSQSGERLRSMLLGSEITGELTGVGIDNDEIYLGGNFKNSPLEGQNMQEVNSPQVFFLRSYLYSDEPPLLKPVDLSASFRSLSFQLDSRGRGVFTGTSLPHAAQNSDLNFEAEQGFVIRVDKEGNLLNSAHFEAPTAILDLAEKGDSEAFIGGYIFAKNNEGKISMKGLLGVLTWKQFQ
jgi:hypothetical protein